MAVSIRLWRGGAKKRPYYRVVAADSRSPRDGRFVEILGHYHPIEETPDVELNAERILEYLNQGAQISDTVRSLLVKKGVELPERFPAPRTRKAKPKKRKKDKKAD